jgi:hypothetical protein
VDYLLQVVEAMAKKLRGIGRNGRKLPRLG